MAEEFDSARFAAEVLNFRIDQLAGAVAKGWTGAKAKVKAKVASTFTRYLESLWTRHSKAKTFFHRHEPVPLKDFYVPLDVSSGPDVLRRVAFTELFSASPHVLIAGGAGCGKTTLLRHLMLGCVDSQLKIPVFAELRELNRQDVDLSGLLVQSICQPGEEIDPELFEVILKHGRCAFFLDGFDEVLSGLKDSVSDQIRALAATSPDNAVLLTSRPEPRVERWPDFRVWVTCPLSVNTASELVVKLPYANDIKASFVEDLEDQLFKTHRSFLSNPLLLTIMLLCYGRSACIPEKLNVFYSQAFEALFQHHDARKGAYKRSLESELDIQDFRTLLAAFCMVTYDEHLIEFDQQRARMAIEQAKQISGVETDTESFLEDLTESVCLLVQDGLMLTFAHRSFQDYFVASFISSATRDRQKVLLERYKSHWDDDDVIELTMEMDPAAVEDVLILPILDSLARYLDSAGDFTLVHFRRFMNWRIKQLSIGSDVDRQRGLVMTQQDADVWRDDGTAPHAVYRSIFRKYQGLVMRAKPDRESLQRLLARLERDYFSNGPISVAELDGNSSLVRELFANRAGWYDFLNTLLQVREQIRLRKESRRKSLSDILGV